MTPQILNAEIVRRVLVFAIKKAITKEGAAKCLALLAGHIESSETKVDDEIWKVFGPAASHVLAGAKAGMTGEDFESLVFESLEIAAAATPAAWDDALVKAARAAAPIARGRGR
ncbi:MAG: hypothetical protein OEV92_01570 [Nitrospinota bacterium]|nr:hypothetical protein [Nitrospinota bacterium]